MKTLLLLVGIIIAVILGVIYFTPTRFAASEARNQPAPAPPTTAKPASADAAVSLPPTLTIDGQTFEGVRYSGHDAATVSITHKDGLARIAFSKLPENIRNAFDYDATAAAKAESDRAALAAEYRERPAERQKAQASERAQQSTSEQAVAEDRNFKTRAMKEGKIVRAEVFRVFGGGVLAYEMEPGSWAGSSGLGRVGGGDQPSLSSETAIAISDDTAERTGKVIFIKGYQGQPAEGDKIKVGALPDGNFEYIDTAGSTRTVAAWRAALTYQWRTDAILK